MAAAAHDSAPASHAKYDRQLRLWGADGQRALTESRICLLNAGPTGSEALKNLVLPGCGSVCVVDGAAVSADDCLNNFFVDVGCVGAPRARVVAELLAEMNPDVRGDFVSEDIDAVLRRDPGFLSRFTLVIATQMPAAALAPVAAAAWAAGVPLLAARSYGLVGAVRVAAREHTIVEAKPDSGVEDLRIAAPWPALRAYVDAIDLGAVDDLVHSHVPYVALLVKALDEWRAEVVGAEGGAPPPSASASEPPLPAAPAPPPRAPRTAGEKAAFKAAVRRLARAPDEVNFREAGEHAFTAYALAQPDGAVAELLRDGAGDALTPASPPFWFVVRALRDFRESAAAGDGALPLAGALPDMTATTELYVGLQRLFADKAAADRDAVAARVATLLASAGAPPSHVPPGLVALMCRHARHLAVLRTRPVAAELAAGGAAAHVEDLESELAAAAAAATAAAAVGGAPPSSPVAWYLMLRGADAFHERMGRFPGQAVAAGAAADEAAQLAADAAQLHALVLEMLAGLGVPPDVYMGAITPAHAVEMTRYGAGEAHAVAAIVGAIVAQEAIKLITHQYVPLNNTFVYDGVAGVGAVLEV